jgi:hypothetical protein
MTLKFVPPRSINRYALFVDRGRRPLAAYDDLAHAKGAWHVRARRYYDAKILENVEGQWYVLYDLPKGLERAPWYKEIEVGRWNNRRMAWRAKPMTRDEYADWRIKVERERNQEQLAALFNVTRAQ